MNKYCELTGVGIIPWGPICRGFLARAVDSQQTVRGSEDKAQTGHSEIDKLIIARVEEIAKKNNWKMCHVVLAWIGKRVTSPIVGMSSVERIDEILGVRGKELAKEEEKYLEELYGTREVEGHN